MISPTHSSEEIVRTHLHLRFVMVAALSLGLSAPAAGQLTEVSNAGGAQVGTAYFGGGPPPQTVTTTFGPIGGVAFADLSPFSFGRLRAVQTGYGLNAVSVDAHLQDVPVFSWLARTSYNLHLQNSGSRTIPSLDFQYHINGGLLELLDPSMIFQNNVARVSARINTTAPGFGGAVWAWELSLHTDALGHVISSVDFFFDPYGFGMPNLSPITIANGRASLTIGSFTARADLGGIQVGDNLFVDYDMDAEVSGSGFGTGGVARLGDPFDANGNYGAGFTLTEGGAVVATPEPATLWLLATGLVLVGALRRKATLLVRS